MVTDAVVALPAWSFAVPVTTSPVVSVEMTTGSGQLATPLMASEQVKLTVTLALLHPDVLGYGFTESAIVVRSLSIPINSIVIPLLGWMRSSTVIVLLASNGTSLSRKATVVLRSKVPTISRPFRLIVTDEIMVN